MLKARRIRRRKAGAHETSGAGFSKDAVFEEHALAAEVRCQHAPLHRAAMIRSPPHRVMEPLLVDMPCLIGVEDNKIRIIPDVQVAFAGQPKDPRRSGSEDLNKSLQRKAPLGNPFTIEQ